MLTVFILVSMVVLKFRDGGWITIFVTGTLMLIAGAIRRFYARTQKQLTHLDGLVEVVEATRTENHRGAAGRRRRPRYNAQARTAVILVSGFNGMGLHTLFNVVRLFGKGVKNFFFIQAGIIDAETFKGKDELERLEAHVKESLDKYVDYVRNQGFYARGYPLLATDVVDEISVPRAGDLPRTSRTASSSAAASSSRKKRSSRACCTITSPSPFSAGFTSPASRSSSYPFRSAPT